MDWDDLARLAADPLVTIGSATVNYPVLSNLKDADAEREMTMGRAVARGRVPPRRQAFRLSVRRSRRFRPQARPDGRGGRLRQRGVGAIGRGSRRGPNQSARAAAPFLGRTAALAARHAGAAVRRHLRAGGADAASVRVAEEPAFSSWPSFDDPAPFRRLRCLDQTLNVRLRHPADDRHRRQHPSDAGHHIEDRLQQAGIRQPRRLRHRHAQQRPHHDEDEQGDGSDEFAGAYRHDG